MSVIVLVSNSTGTLTMPSLKSVLVHLDASERSAARLKVATEVAHQHAANTAAMFAVTPSVVMYPYTLAYSPEALPVMREFEADRRDRARKTFDRACASAQVSPAWMETSDEPVRAFARQALYADLLVLGQYQPDLATSADVPTDFVESVLIGSGRPALVLPYIGTFESIGRVALVAWKESRESARALSASLPFLQRADKVHVAMWDEGSSDAAPGTDLQAYLHSHGVAATLHRNGKATADIGQYLLSMASDLGADLLVMGCYGHTRSREWVLGGATRSVIRSMTLPVLMSH